MVVTVVTDTASSRTMNSSKLGLRKVLVIALPLAWVLDAAAQAPSVGQVPTTPIPNATIPGVNSPSTTLPSSELPALGAGTATQNKDELKFLPGVRSSLTYSSNLARTANSSAGWIAEVSPYVQASINSDRTKGDLYATLRGFFRTQGGSSLSPDLRANGQTALIGDWLWISGAANIYSVASNVFGATAPV